MLLLVVILSCALLCFGVPISHPTDEEYIVIFNSSHPSVPQIPHVLNRLSLSSNHSNVHHVYDNAVFRGFHASLQSHCINHLRDMSGVALVEKQVPVRVAVTARVDAPWGLQRISTAESLPDGGTDLNYTYTYANDDLGSNADIYILDTGVYTQHVAFTGRAKMAWSFDGNLTDNDGHGTHVSGIAAGAAIGVASNANIIGVKAVDIDGTGYSSNVVGAVDYVIQAHNARKSDPNFTGSVISMSLESDGVSSAMNQVLQSAVDAGIHVVVAAGNSGTDACQSSPASAGGQSGTAISVGSIGISAEVSSFSNTGRCVDVYAPGEEIISSWNSGPHDLKMLSGTSMATPHVTGILAYAMARNKTLANSPSLMKEWIKGTAISGMVSGKVVLGDECLLANNGMPEGPRGTEQGLINS